MIISIGSGNRSPSPQQYKSQIRESPEIGLFSISGAFFSFFFWRNKKRKRRELEMRTIRGSLTLLTVAVLAAKWLFQHRCNAGFFECAELVKLLTA